MSLKMSAMLPSNSEKQSMIDIRQKEGCQAATGWQTGRRQQLAGAKFAYIGKVCVSDQNFNCNVLQYSLNTELPLQNLFPFF